MKKGLINGLFILFLIFLLSFFEVVWGQVIILSQTPADKSYNNPTNTMIRIQFNKSMNPSSLWIEVEDDHNQDILGTIRWTKTNYEDDTFEFIPEHPLRPAGPYSYEGNVSSTSGEEIWFKASFITKTSTADSTPPTVQTNFPYDGMNEVSIGGFIAIKFSEAMNPPSITTPGNIILNHA